METLQERMVRIMTANAAIFIQKIAEHTTREMYAHGIVPTDAEIENAVEFRMDYGLTAENILMERDLI